MINHIDEHNTGILDFPAFYKLVKKKSRDQVKVEEILEAFDPPFPGSRKSLQGCIQGLQ